ncbi:MAG: ATP-binding protein [Gammaproteobacteria bacterium]
MHPFPRVLRHRLDEAMTDTPVVLIAGPRQAGKTTLARTFVDADRPYLTLDDQDILAAARRDPVGLIRLQDRVVIDEIQRVPELLLAIKRSVDEDRRPGRFLLTGSANLMLLPTVADSLAGRMETLHLLPLAQAELSGLADADRGGWLEAVFAGRMPQPAVPGEDASLTSRVLHGGYPEMLARESERARQRWARQYLDALLRRDVRDIAAVDKLEQLPRLLSALAHVSGQLCNFTELGGQLGLDRKTAVRYLAIFEQMFLLQRLPPWSGNGIARLVKTPKFHFLDSGLLAALRGASAQSLVRDRTAFGSLLESFVFSELLKMASWSDRPWRLSFFRDKDGHEVDFVIESDAGGLVGIEVKAAASVQANDFRGLRRLAVLAGGDFRAGIVLYDGRHTLPMGDGLWAVPLRTLGWG